MSTGPHQVICLNGVTPAAVSYAPLAAALSGRAELILKDLEGYAPDFPKNYGPTTELEAISRATEGAGWQRIHLVGQSFGASVALAFACEHSDLVQSLSLIEPPFVGNDTSWSEVYAELVGSPDQALRAPLADRPAAFRSALTAAGEAPAPAAPATAPEWLLPRSERQGRMWRRWRDPDRGPRQLAPSVANVHLAVGRRTHPGSARLWIGSPSESPRPWSTYTRSEATSTRRTSGKPIASLGRSWQCGRLRHSASEFASTQHKGGIRTARSSRPALFD